MTRQVKSESSMRLRAIVLVLALMTFPAAALPPAVPVYREFGRWLVACDNVRACVARGFDETTRAELDLARLAGAATATLAFSAEQPVARDSMRMDGKPIALAAPAWSMKDGAPSTKDPDAVAAFIALARAGHVVTLDSHTPTDDAPRSVPLQGFNAALLFIDAVQGRVGTPTALIAAKGDGVPPPALPLPAAPQWRVPPALTPAEMRRLGQQAHQLHSPEFGTCDVNDPPAVYPLDATHALAIRPCYLAAYQGSSVVAVLPRAGGPAAPVTLALPGLPHDATDGPDMVDPDFDSGSGTLSSVSKGRGLADCGASGRWVWRDGAFRLKALNYQDMCGGTSPGDWPALYRTR